MDRELYKRMYTLGERKREVFAQHEVGRTAVSRGLAWLLAALFVLTVSAVPVGQYVFCGASATRPHDIFERLSGTVAANWRGPTFAGRVLSANGAAVAAMRDYERGLEQDFFLRPHVVPWAQWATIRWLGVANEQVTLGRDRWLFHRRAVDHVTGPGFLTRRGALGDADPVATIVDLAEQLRRRDIELIVVPVPAKPQVHPEKFSARYDGHYGPLHNASFARFKTRLAEKGVLVFDPAEALLRAKRRTGRPQYLASDTHWTPAAAERVAGRLKEFIDGHVELPAAETPAHALREVRAENAGDLARMLRLPEDWSPYRSREVVLNQVVLSERYVWGASRDADVLVLGDSFSNIYSLEAMGWGEAAGFVEHLSFVMARPLDRITRNGDGASATRRLLAGELARGRDRLDGKRLVIWQFAAHELSFGDWEPIEVKLGRPGPTAFLDLAPGDRLTRSGVVHSVAPVPRPGTVPYKDHITTLLLVDLTGEKGELIPGSRALVYAWSMRDAVWTSAARLRPGRRIQVRLRPWADVADKYEGINRTELDDDALLLEPACWAEEVGE